MYCLDYCRGISTTHVCCFLSLRKHKHNNRHLMSYRVYAQIEQQYASASTAPSSPSRSLTSSIQSTPNSLRASRHNTKEPTSNNRILKLRLRATSLVHTHSIQQRLVPTFIAKPDTYFEISRPSYFTTDTGSTIRHFGPALSARIVLHHSPSVNESIYNVG
jgi:hypothetical protein